MLQNNKIALSKMHFLYTAGNLNRKRDYFQTRQKFSASTPALLHCGKDKGLFGHPGAKS
jgi:hypothetical protein